MYDCTLTQLESTHDNVRTRQIVGKCDELPTVGKMFYMTSEPLDPGYAVRLFKSSPVQDVLMTERVDTIRFRTENSQYVLRFKEQEEE